MLNIKDASEVIEYLREYGYAETDIASVIEGINDGFYSLSDVADFIQAMEEGDDDTAFMEACNLGLA